MKNQPKSDQKSTKNRSWRPLGASWGGLEGLEDILGASWGRLGGLLGFILEVLGRFLGILEAKLEENIVLGGFRFSGGPSWRRLRVVFRVLGDRFGLDFEAF